MRTISQSLLRAQLSQAPQTRVQCRFEDMGYWHEDSADWELLATLGDTMSTDSYTVVAITLASGVVIVGYVVDGVGIYMRRVTDPSDASSWATAVHLIDGDPGVGNTSEGLALLANGNEVRAIYVSSGDLWQCKSTNGGASWGTPTLIVTTVFSDSSYLTGFYHSALGWVIFHCPDGIEMVRSANGTTWTATTQYASIYFRPIGVDYDAATNTARVFLWGNESERSVIAQITYSFASSTYSNLTYIDHVGSARSVQSLNMRVARGLNQLMFVGFERTYADAVLNAYFVLGNIDATDAYCDEPILYVDKFLFEPVAWVAMVVAGGITYLISRLYVYWAPRKLGVGTIGTEWRYPSRYRYTRIESSSGELELDLPANIGRPRNGCLLRLRRGVFVDGGGDEIDSLLRVVHIEHRRDVLIVQAVDALGVLGLFRARRSYPMVAAYYNWESAVKASVARAGIDGYIPHGPTDIFASSNPLVVDTDYKDFVLNANENLLSFLFRLLRAKRIIYRVHSGLMSVEFVGLPSNAPYAYGEGGHPLMDWAFVSDGRALGLTVFMGRALTADPIGEGEGWAIANGARIDGVRPVPTVYRDRRLIGGEVTASADGDGARLRTENMDVRISAVANVALEIYDRVVLTVREMGWQAQLFRVNSIDELWENGLLTQELGLGDDA